MKSINRSKISPFSKYLKYNWLPSQQNNYTIRCMEYSNKVVNKLFKYSIVERVEQKWTIKSSHIPWFCFFQRSTYIFCYRKTAADNYNSQIYIISFSRNVHLNRNNLATSSYNTECLGIPVLTVTFTDACTTRASALNNCIASNFVFLIQSAMYLYTKKLFLPSWNHNLSLQYQCFHFPQDIYFVNLWEILIIT